MNPERKLLKVAIVAGSIVGLTALLLLAAVWAPLYVGSSENKDVPLSPTQAATARQQAEYGVLSGTTVLAEITKVDRRVVSGAEFYSARFPLNPYELVIRCNGESLGVQESVGYRQRLQLQQAGSGGHRDCGARESMGVPAKGKSVTVDVIDTQLVGPDWGVLVICSRGHGCE